jgi:hypothetical protein
VKTKLLKDSGIRKRRIEHRLRPIDWDDQVVPMLSATNIHYEVAEKSRGIGVGGIGAIHMLATRVGLPAAINDRVKVLKKHLPYWESDHVLNIAYNVACGGRSLEDIEHRRNDEVFMDGVGAQRIPDPTTAGDFCRRFEEQHIEQLMEAVNECRLRVWRQQPESFFEQAIVEADGTVVPTYGECKEGMDFNYAKKLWGYHPLVVTLANTGEPLYIVNRSGNRPSHEGAAARFDQAAALLREAGFQRILFRGDTDFSQTAYLDGWHRQGIEFVFGMDANPTLVRKAEALGETAWNELSRKPKYTVKTDPRQRPDNVKEQLVRDKGYRNLHLEKEDIAEFEYSPTKCRESYRIIALRKHISVEQGQQVLFTEYRYFFYITNQKRASARQIVEHSNNRCDQENKIAQLKDLRALHSPVDNMLSNWAYMVMASLAWSLKAWYALLLPISGRWRKRHESEKDQVLKMEFRTFVNSFIHMPAQIVKAGRRILFRLLGWNRWQHVFLRGLHGIRMARLC